MHSLFEKTDLAGITMNNRILRSATHETMADGKGFPTEELKRKYLQLARGGVGAIITGYAGVQPDGRSHRMLMIDRDEPVPAYKDLVAAVHAENTPIIMQIAHCGRQTRRAVTGTKPVAPSAVRDTMFSEERPRELSEEEIETIIENFVKAIARAKRAGFDGVQMHIAHGYLLAQFLSNHSNRRKDRWGGSLENRFRIVGEIFSRAKKEAGDFPLWAKINAYDGQKNGMRLDESVQIAKMLEDAGCGCIEVSCGVFEDGFFTTRGEKPPVDALLAYNFKFDAVPGALKPLLRPVIPRILPSMPRPVYNYNVDAAAAIKERVSVPVIAVGGIRSLEDMRSILDSGKADFVAMCRPLIMEPGLVNKFKEGAQERSRCIDCNFCAIAQEKNPLRCYRGKVR